MPGTSNVGIAYSAPQYSQRGGYKTEEGRRRYGIPFYQFPQDLPTGAGGVGPGWKLDSVYGWYRIAVPQVQATGRSTRPNFSAASSGCCGGSQIALPNRDTGGDVGGGGDLIFGGGGGPGSVTFGAGGGNSYNVDGVGMPPRPVEVESFLSAGEIVKAIFLGLIVTAAIYLIKRRAL